MVGAIERQTIASAITANAIFVFISLYLANFFFENVLRFDRLRHSLIITLSGTIEKDVTERTILERPK